jgi:hypothetical protein
MKKDYDPNEMLRKAQAADVDGDGVVTSQELLDSELLKQQRQWVGRLQNIY